MDKAFRQTEQRTINLRTDQALMPLKELRSYIAIVDNGGLTATARQLRLPKSTLSRHLKKLEGDIGHVLLRRESNRLIPTEAGQAFYRYGVELIQLMDEGMEELERLNEDIQGELVVYVNSGLIRGWLGEVIDSFMIRQPQVRFTLHSYLGSNTTKWRDAICLWMGDLPDHPLRQERLGLLSQGIYGQRAYLERFGPIQNPQELCHHQWINLAEESHTLTMKSPQGERVEVELPPCRLKADQLMLQADAIAAGHGLGVMPNWQASKRMAFHPGCFERCLPDWDAPAVPVWLAYPHGKLPRKYQAFIAHLRQSLPAAWAR